MNRADWEKGEDVPWGDPKYAEAKDRQYGLNPEDQRMSSRRFVELCRRQAEWELIDFTLLDATQVETARILLVDMQSAVRQLIADKMARRPWWRRVFGS